MMWSNHVKPKNNLPFVMCLLPPCIDLLIDRRFVFRPWQISTQEIAGKWQTTDSKRYKLANSPELGVSIICSLGI